MKDTLKDVNVQADERAHRSRSRGSWVQELVPVGLGCPALPACRHVHQPRSSLHPVLWDFYGYLTTEAWMIIKSISSPSFLPGGWGWGSGWKFQVSHHGLVFLVISIYPEATEEPKWVSSLKQVTFPITQGIPRDLAALARNWVKDQTKRTEDAPSGLIT